MSEVIQKKFQQVKGALNAAYVDRGKVIDGLLTALVARQHVFLLGPPGVAKSALANALADAVDGGQCFIKLLTRTTTPEEIWGPIDLVAFDQGEFKRKVDGYLPTAHVCFLDELWRGSSAILNGLLTAINERQWEDDGQRKSLPLRSVVGASNSLPESGDLDALYDRFCLRYMVRRVTRRTDRKRILKIAGTGEPVIRHKITVPELDEAHKVAMRVKVSESFMGVILDVWDQLLQRGYDVSERRWRQILSCMRASAWLNGRDEVTASDLQIVADCAWNKPEERTEVLKVVLEHATPSVARAVEIHDAAVSAARRVPKWTGDNDVQVAREASTAKKAVKELVADLQEVIKKSASHERTELESYNDKLLRIQKSLTKKMAKVIGGSVQKGDDDAVEPF